MAPRTSSRPAGLPDRIFGVHLKGEMHEEELSAFEIEVEHAMARGDVVLVVDLRDLTFVGSAVVNAMFRACRRLRQAGGAIAIVCTDPHSLRVIDVTGLARAVAVCDDIDAAVRAVSPHVDGFH